MGLYGNYDQSELRLPTVIMDTEYDPSVTMDGASDVEDEEPTERRHRRDFVGTELERPKKGSRKSHRKRQQPSQSQINQNEAGTSNSMTFVTIGLHTPPKYSSFCRLPRYPPFAA